MNVHTFWMVYPPAIHLVEIHLMECCVCCVREGLLEDVGHHGRVGGQLRKVVVCALASQPLQVIFRDQACTVHPHDAGQSAKCKVSGTQIFTQSRQCKSALRMK